MAPNAPPHERRNRTDLAQDIRQVNDADTPDTGVVIDQCRRVGAHLVFPFREPLRLMLPVAASRVAPAKVAPAKVEESLQVIATVRRSAGPGGLGALCG